MVVSFAEKVTASIGKRLLTMLVPIRVMLILLNQRLALEVLSWRRGERDSQIATAIKTPRKAVSRIKGS
jgi:hypothetical protein